MECCTDKIAASMIAQLGPAVGELHDVNAVGRLVPELLTGWYTSTKLFATRPSRSLPLGSPRPFVSPTYMRFPTTSMLLVAAMVAWPFMVPLTNTSPDRQLY